MSTPKTKKKLTPRQERRKQFIQSYLKKDRFVNIRTDQLRLIVDEEQELYDFLELMDTALMGKESEKPEFMDKILTIEENGIVALNGTSVDFSGDPTPEFEESLWILTQPNSAKKVNEANRNALCNNLLALIERLCSLDRESAADLRRRMGVDDTGGVRLALVDRQAATSFVVGGLLLFGVYALVTGVDFVAVFRELGNAELGVLAAALVVSLAIPLFFGMSTVGACSSRIPYWPSVVLQNGIQAASLAMPGSAARAALSITYFRRFGLGPVRAVSVGAIDTACMLHWRM